ncbi:TonB-dependent receptor [Sphingobacteriales bacterium UPWRP_1]|nr:TonB-dependent receptor [Sphingobacteriales bacterium UPWRP_1]
MFVQETGKLLRQKAILCANRRQLQALMLAAQRCSQYCLPTIHSLPMKHLLFCLSFLVVSTSIYAQKGSVSGTVTDAGNSTTLVGATVLLYGVPDSSRSKGTITDETGKFTLQNMPKGQYNLRVSFIGYAVYQTAVTVGNKAVNAGVIALTQETELLKEVQIESTQIRAQQKGDTTEYNANAYKVNPDADAQQLIAKMPNINVENGTVKAQGEDVKKVLIDGKEYFGDDATLALRSLPAEVIDKIQVFDRMSDQSRFTGFSDGNDQKTLNIVTKAGKNNGQFGKIYAGYGTNNRYWAGGNVNLFKGKRRISILGLTNNINQQNFDTQDLLGVFGSQGNRRNWGGPGMGRGGPGGHGGRPGGGGGGYGGGDMYNFLVGQQGGITAATALGINYADKWGKKTDVTASYFFNYSDNNNNTTLTRTLLTGTQNQVYSENNEAQTKNYNHRLSLRMEFTIDSANSIILTPKLSLQNNSKETVLQGQNTLADALLNQANNFTAADNNGYNFTNDLLLRHKFKKNGRTVSVNFGTELNNKTGNTNLQSETVYYTLLPDTAITLAQQANTNNNSRTFSGNVTYTEPTGKNGQLQLSYSPSATYSLSDKKTFNFDALSNEYTLPDILLTNKFENNYTTHRTGISYRYNTERANFMAGVNHQYALLNGQQLFPPLPLQLGKAEKTFTNFLPTAMFQYKFSTSANIRVFYRTSTSPPSVTQLQNVIDNTNPLLLNIGNPDLKQNFFQMLVTRFGFANTTTGRSLFAFVFTSNTINYIGNSVIVAQSDTTILNNVPLLKGAQLNKPVNLNGYWNVRSFLTYGMPVKALKSNLNLNAGFTYSRTPGLVNNQTNNANNYNVNGGLVLGSNISEKIDFTISYTANYNIVNNSILPELNNNFFLQQAGARVSWQFWKGFVINTEANETLYKGLDASLNQQFLLWNAGLAYKFLKNNAAEVQIKVYDLLNQNNSLTRNVTETYVEDTQTQVLRRYAMLTFTYNLRNFKAAQNSGNAGSGQSKGAEGR